MRARDRARRAAPLIAALLVLAPALALAPRAAAGGKIYWTNHVAPHAEHATYIGRANVDGTGIDRRFIHAWFPWGITVDRRAVYWANRDWGFGAPRVSRGRYGNIGRATLNGTFTDRSFISSYPWCCPEEVAVDGAHVYWTTRSRDGISRADKRDGATGGGHFIGIGKGHPGGIAVNATHIYWTNRGKGTIGRANLNGTGVDQRYIRTRHHPGGIAVNATHIYWTNRGKGTIGRAKLDGTGVDRSFVRTRGHPYGVAVGRGRG